MKSTLTMAALAMALVLSACAERRPARAAGALHNVEYGRGGARALKMNISLPEGTAKNLRPAIVWLHAGGWRHGDKDSRIHPVVGKLARLGYVTASVEYRLTDEAIFPAQIEDCKCAVRFLRANALMYGIDSNRIGVIGASAGGHLAALLGTSGGEPSLEGDGGWSNASSRVQAVVDLFGPTDLPGFVEDARRNPHQRGAEDVGAADAPLSRLLGGPVLKHPEEARRASPLTYVDKDDPPFLILHGDHDATVPPAQARRLYDALKEAGNDTELVIVTGGRHGLIEPEVTERILVFFQEKLPLE
ncbi:MAG: alpha/beta hydrolase [bacterium]